MKTSSPGDVTPPATPCIRDNTGCTPQTSGFGELTAEQGTLAKAIAQRDPTLRSLLADKTYTLGYGRWELSGELVGAIMTIGLDQTIYVDANLPSVDVGYRGGPPATYVKLPPPYYVETTAHFTIEAQYFAVIVDFSREKVIYIRPDPPGSLGVS